MSENTFNIKDQVTIKRGRDAGQTGVIVEQDEDQFGVKLDSGKLRLVTASNLKAPVARTVTESDLIARFETEWHETLGDRDVLIDLAKSLEDVLPGFLGKLNLPVASAE